MAAYVNPPGAPPVMFNGPVVFSLDEVAAACRHWGPMLELQKCDGLFGPQLLWAIAEVESERGKNAKPRHELGFCKGKYSQNDKVLALTKRFGHAAHCSFGPWQLMLVNLPGDVADLGAFDTADGAAAATVIFLNEVILGRQGARTIEQIADAYNSGNFRDKNVPEEYIAKVKAAYLQPMPAPRVLPK